MGHNFVTYCSFSTVLNTVETVEMQSMKNREFIGSRELF